jgi:hypothetical protein
LISPGESGHTHHQKGVSKLAPLESLGAIEIGLVLRRIAPHMKQRSIVDDVSGFLFFPARYAMPYTEALAQDVLRKGYVIHGRTALSFLICCIAHWVIFGELQELRCNVFTTVKFFAALIEATCKQRFFH